MRPRDLIELVRAPGALSVPGDAVAGAAAAGCLNRRTAGIAAASVCLYWAGMAANDWADRELDAVERPTRPIPSGRVGPRQALFTAGGLTATGLAIAAAAGGRRVLPTAAALAAAVWTYDLKLKNTAAGPAGMALCRGLDVLLGAAPGRVRRALRPAAVMAAHTWAVTELSRRETTGADPVLPAATMTATAGIAAASTARPEATPRTSGAASALLAGRYAFDFGRAQRAAVARPDAGTIRSAVAAGITSMPTLQGALASRSGRPLVGLAVAALAPLGRRLAKAVSPT